MYSASKSNFKKASAGADSYYDQLVATYRPEDIDNQLLQDVARLDAEPGLFLHFHNTQPGKPQILPGTFYTAINFFTLLSL